MAERRPLVNISGNLQELPTGDTLPGVASSVAVGTADVRLDYSDASTLALNPVAGLSGLIEVNGESVDCSTPLTLAKTANLISAAGADVGSAMSAGTFYYVYVSNSSASYAPSSVRASTTAPTAGYLGASGNAAEWRYVGDCYLWSDGSFYDTAQLRLVRSEYNTKLVKVAAIFPSTWNYATATWREVNAGSGVTRGYFLGDGKNQIDMNLQMLCLAYYGRTYTSRVYFDGATAGVQASLNANVGSAGQYIQNTINATYQAVVARGLHNISGAEFSNGGSSTGYGGSYGDAYAIIPI